MSQSYLLSIDASDDEIPEIVRALRAMASGHGGTLKHDPSPAVYSHHGVLDLPHIVHFLFEVSGELVLGILANAIYSALSKRKTHTEVSLYEHTSKREVEIVDTASGLRLKIRQVDKEAARHTID